MYFEGLSRVLETTATGIEDVTRAVVSVSDKVVETLDTLTEHLQDAEPGGRSNSPNSKYLKYIVDIKQAGRNQTM